MNLLLDTHALIWWLEGSPRLSRKAETAIADIENRVLVSAACGWEIATKNRLGKLPMPDGIVRDLPAQMEAEGFELLPISFRHAWLAGTLQNDHRDPFDRMLAAQTLADSLTLVSADGVFDSFGAPRLW